MRSQDSKKIIIPEGTLDLLGATNYANQFLTQADRMKVENFQRQLILEEKRVARKAGVPDVDDLSVPHRNEAFKNAKKNEPEGFNAYNKWQGMVEGMMGWKKSDG